MTVTYPKLDHLAARADLLRHETFVASETALPVGTECTLVHRNPSKPIRVTVMGRSFDGLEIVVKAKHWKCDQLVRYHRLTPVGAA